MSFGFLDHMRVVPDHRIAAMATYPLDQILLATLAGGGVRGGQLGGRRGGRDRSARLAARLSAVCERHCDGADPSARCFALSTRRRWRGGVAGQVVAVDGKTLRGSKGSADGKGAPHLVSAYATEAGPVLAQRAIDGKSNEITAIPFPVRALGPGVP
jgi:hypothetical protein